MLAAMNKRSLETPVNPPIELLPIASGEWTATLQTPAGPLTAVGATAGEAMRALDELRVLSRAVEVTRRESHR